MSDDIPDDQLNPMQNDFTDMDEHYDEEEDANDLVSAEDARAAAYAILPDDDTAIVQHGFGVEGSQEVTSDHEDQPENAHESVHDDLEPARQPPDQHDVDLNDSSSLFVPETYQSRPPAPAPPPLRPTAASPRQGSTPARPAVKLSAFAKIREVQKRARERQAAFARSAAASRSIPEGVDREAYLDAVTAGIRPPPGRYPQPEIDVDEREHRQALAKFQQQKQHYEGLQEDGRLTFRAEVEWMKIKGAEHARTQKRRRELVHSEIQDGGEQDLFPPLRDFANQDGYESAHTNHGESTSRKRRRERNTSGSFQDAELQSMRVALDADKDVPKKKTKKGSTDDNNNNNNNNDEEASQSTSKSRGSKTKTSRAPRAKAKAGAKPAAKGPRKTAKHKRDIERATKQAASLFNSNVFDQQAGMDAADQPLLRTGSKRNALKELIASLPVEEKQQARNDMNSLIQASKDFDGRGACKLAPGNNGHWLVRGMATSLKNYQVLGSAFMRRRENDHQEPKGGLMADQMGLGKTLMMLANIVNSLDAMERNHDTGPKTTLLVASPALLTQWAGEIQSHTKLNLSVMRYGPGNRLDSTNVIHTLGDHDIILTTYGEVMKSYPKNEPPIECQTAEQKIAWWKRTFDQCRGVLHQMLFKRIVLDEAQAIKNHKSRTSIACRALMAHHRWALSGTPIQNGLDELYPYFKFLNVPHTGSFQIFKNNYCGGGKGENSERLLVRLSQFMIRRTHADRMFDAPILKLPQASQSTYWCEFNHVERCIYNIVHQRFAMRINSMSKEGKLEPGYSNVLVMLLRLRQLTGHILMLQFVMRDLLEQEDIERIKDVVKEQAASSNMVQGRTILSIRKQLEAYELREKRRAAAKAAKRVAAEDAARRGAEYVEPESDEDDEEDEGPVQVPHGGEEEGEDTRAQRGAERAKSGKAFGKSYDFKPYVNSLTVGDSWEQKKERAKCAECGKRPFKPWKTACGHFICSQGCYEEAMNAAAEEGRSYAMCKACGQTFFACTPCDEEEDDDDGAAHGTRSRAAARERKKKERLDREDIAEEWLELGGDEVLPSAKTIAIKAQVLNWLRENPEVKIIIYTQFLAMIRILAKMCQQEGWKAEQYHGKLSLGARDKSIKEFATDPNSKILLASLRCGGLGLNLTMASKVIIIDPWWNEASEQQAFCRVFRIGQQDETIMTRMCVKETVDERLIEMQKNKQREIDEVMEDRGKKTKHLDIGDLMRLFGNIEEGGEGRSYIMVENPDTVGGFFANADHEGYADEY